MLMTAAQVAEHTQLNVRTVWRKARCGELPCYRIGRMVRFKLEDVELAMKGDYKCQKRSNEVPKQPRM